MRPQRNADVKTTPLPDGCIVLFTTKTDWAQILNPAGAIVWEFCDGEHTVPEIASEVCTLLGVVQESNVVSDVEALVKELVDSGQLFEN